MSLVTIPKLSELLEHPERVSALPPEAVPGMIGDLVRLLAIVWTQLMAANHDGQGLSARDDGDRLLNVEEAAQKLCKSKDYIYRKADEFPFTVRDGRSLRFSNQGIEKFIRQRMGR